MSSKTPAPSSTTTAGDSPFLIHQTNTMTTDSCDSSSVIPQGGHNTNPLGELQQRRKETSKEEEDVLLPCQFCWELFSITTFESHQQHCMSRQPDPSLMSSSGGHFTAVTPPNSPHSAENSYQSSSPSSLRHYPPPSFILSPPTTPHRPTVQPTVATVIPSYICNVPSILERESTILTVFGGYGHCRHCEVKLLSCSVKYHEKICPQKSDTPIQNVTIGSVLYMKCRHCNVSLLSCSVKYHEKICPQNPTPFVPRNNYRITPQITRIPPLEWNPAITTRNFPPITRNSPPITRDSPPITRNSLPITRNSPPITRNSPRDYLTTNTETGSTMPTRNKLEPHTNTLSINIVTWNLNKGTVPRGASTAGFADTTRLLMAQFLEQHPNSLYCFQEINVSIAMPSYSHQQGGNRLKHAGVACPAIQGVAMETFNPPQRNTSKCTYDNVANCRFYGKQVLIKDDSGVVRYKFMLISYHGKHYQMNDDTKLRALQDFFTEMCTVADIHGMTLIIGGDFNLRLQSWNATIKQLYPGRIHIAQHYNTGIETRRNGAELIDTFAVVYPSNTQYNTHCIMNIPQAISLHSSLPSLQQIYGPAQADILFNLMDHDPVIVNVTLSTSPSSR